MIKQIQSAKTSPNPESVATYGIGRLGDLLVSTPILRAIHLLYPSAQHTLIGNSVWRQILLPSEWPQINLFLESDSTKFQHLTLYKPNLQTNTWEKIEIIPSISKFLKNYQMGISLRYRSVRFAIEMIRARMKYRVGSHNKWWTRFLYSHFYQAKNISIHVRDTHLKVLDINKFKDQFGQHFILINPTSSMREKTWNSKNWLKRLAVDYAPIYQPNSIFDTCDLIAASTGTRTITLMGIAHPKVWGPLGKNDIVIKAKPLADEVIQKKSSIPRLQQHKIIEQRAYRRITIDSVLDTLHKSSIIT